MAVAWISERVRVVSTTEGTGDFVLATAVSLKHETFADAGYVEGDECVYVIEHQTKPEIEVGRGTIGPGGVLQRDGGVSMSSNADALVDFSAGNKHVWVDVDSSFLRTTVNTDKSSLGTSLGSVVRRIEVFDAVGTSLGFVPVYDFIGHGCGPLFDDADCSHWLAII